MFDDLVDQSAYGGQFGPAGVHRDEPTFDATSYWRGSSWPQLTYLLWVAASRAGRDGVGAALARSLVDGATRSGFAEHWGPDDAVPLGAVQFPKIPGVAFPTRTQRAWHAD